MCVKLLIAIVLLLSFNYATFAQEDVEPSATPSTDDLQNQELLSAITELLQPDDDCQLPCFWGFVPGITTVADVETFWTTVLDTPIEPINADDGRIFATFWTDFVPQSGYTDISIEMTFSDNTLSRLNVGTFNTSIWLEDDWISLTDAIKELTDDTEFFIRVNKGDISVLLINAKANIMLQKTYRLRVNENIISPKSLEPLLLCPTTDNLFYTSLWLLDGDIPISLEEILGTQIVTGRELAPYQPINFMTNLSADEFSEFVLENPNDCIEMLSYSELLELGYSF